MTKLYFKFPKLIKFSRTRALNIISWEKKKSTGLSQGWLVIILISDAYTFFSRHIFRMSSIASRELVWRIWGWYLSSLKQVRELLWILIYTCEAWLVCIFVGKKKSRQMIWYLYSVLHTTSHSGFVLYVWYTVLLSQDINTENKTA